jgi:O-succinylbenzoic acid--CoA ligase
MTHDAIGGDGRWLLALPTTHIAGLQVLTRSVVSGFPPVVMDLTNGFRVRDLVDATQTLLNDIGPEPRYTSLVPTQLGRVLDAGGAGIAALVAMDAVLLGGARAPAELVTRAHEAGITLVQTYGMTETCGGCVYDGVPLPGVRVSVDAASRIRIESPTLFSGYYQDAASTAAALADGCFVTDDLGEIDTQGRLHVVGHADNVIISGGTNVSAMKVEHAICEYSQVRDAVVFGQSDPEWGEIVVAVVLADGELSLDGLRQALGTRLETDEMPRRFIVQRQLPYLPSGKPDRQAIRRLVFD